MASKSTAFDKYAVYTRAVQAPEYDAKFLRQVYRELVNSEPALFREDFCGTHALACEWVKLADSMHAVGIDIDPEPLMYGTEHHAALLTASQRKRLKTMQGDVLHARLAKADVACAFNFSYFCFHSRQTLVHYFSRVRRSLRSQGIFVVDIFGGPDHAEPSMDIRSISGMKYYFEQEYFDPVSNRTRFHIHFHPKGGRMRKRVFSYDWRMWSIPEIREAMVDAGFDDTVVYWEGTGREGRGNGRYRRREKGESCQVWTAYIVGCNK